MLENVEKIRKRRHDRISSFAWWCDNCKLLLLCRVAQIAKWWRIARETGNRLLYLMMIVIATPPPSSMKEGFLGKGHLSSARNYVIRTPY